MIMQLAKALRYLRLYIDPEITQAHLSSMLGLSKSYVSELEKGKKKCTLEVLERYSNSFDIPVSSIIFLAEHIDRPIPTQPIDLVVLKILELKETLNQPQP